MNLKQRLMLQCDRRGILLADVLPSIYLALMEVRDRLREEGAWEAIDAVPDKVWRGIKDAR